MQGTLTRRRFSRALLALAALASLPLRAFARNDAAFESVEADAALKALFGDKPFIETSDLEFKVPDIAEDGSIVPVTVSTTMQGVQSISLLVEENPNPLSARFHFMPGAVPAFKTRIKMGESSDLRVVIETADALYIQTKNVKVTLGGCGG